MAELVLEAFHSPGNVIKISSRNRDLEARSGGLVVQEARGETDALR